MLERSTRMNRPLPIMIVVPCFGYGGLEQVVLQLARGLDRKSFFPVVYSLIEPEPSLLEDVRSSGIVFKVLEKGQGVNIALPLKLALAMKREGVRLVNSHDIGATIYAASAAFLAGVKHVIHTDHSQILARQDRWRLFGFLLRHFTSFSITVSRELEKTLVEKMGLDKRRVATIPNAIDAARFSSARANPAIRSELGVEASEFIVGSVGRLTRQKGYEYLIKAMAVGTRKDQRERLVIVGMGELRGELENLARSLGVAERVIFTGTRTDVPELLSIFDVFVLPSLWEGQPITLIEAMAAGKAIITTDVGDNAWILGAASSPASGSFSIGERGIIVPAQDYLGLRAALELVVANDTLRKELGSRAARYASSELDPVKMVSSYEHVFNAVLAGELPFLQDAASGKT